MGKIIECVPNFSEGRDASVLDRIAGEIKGVAEVALLDVDPGRDTNRTVFTFAGSPEGVEEAAFRAIRRASELIDMSVQKGAHPRMGATDVCPFVPVSGVTMEECIQVARRLGKRVGEELGIPVYLYEEAASSPERRSLAYLREGEYEALPEKMKKREFRPDFGKAEFNAKAGATVIGAREFLIAYNINLNTRNIKFAKEIANRLREKGYTRKNAKTGEKETVPGTLPAVRAVGWYIDQYQCAQISVNLLNYKVTPFWKVFEEGERIAAEFGLRVTGSELVGLIPLEAIKETGRHFLQKQGGSTAVSERELVKMAVRSLGLAELAPFDPDHKIIEYRFRKPGPLVSMKVSDFCEELASDSPAPGGGSVAALCGALSAALTAMVGNLTYGKKGYEEASGRMVEIGECAQKLKDFFMVAIDRDTEAFNRVMAGFGLPKKTDSEKAARDLAILEANKGATRVPLSVLEKAVEAAQLALAMAEAGNRNSASDAGVAGLTALSAAEGAYYNVLINIKDIGDDDFRLRMRRDADSWLAQAQETAGRIREKMKKLLL